jgi:hypothetical protein
MNLIFTDNTIFLYLENAPIAGIMIEFKEEIQLPYGTGTA